MRARRQHPPGQRGFTMMEIMVSLVITIIGLAGVLMMQASTVKGNRQSVQFTRAAMIAEETMESARGTDINKLLAGVSYPTVTYANVPYAIELTAQEVAAGSNLVRITVTVTYSEEGEASTADDRHVRAQLIRTKTEIL